MIHPLRQRHRYMVIALGILLPIALAAGVALRKPVPTVATLPEGLMVRQQFTTQLWERSDLFAKTSVKVYLLGQRTNGLALSFSAGEDFVKPDLMVYWAAKAPGDLLPGDAVLLGRFGSMPLPMPADLAGADGVLVLYSLADGEIVDVSKPLRLADTTH